MNKYFQAAWDLYLDSFPIDERRELGVQKKIFEHEDYVLEAFIFDDEFIGFLAWWRFDGLRYIEHMATIDSHRGKGYGSRILKKFISDSNEKIILEVELPNSETNKRRIGFYERLDFKLNQYEYQQLPYRKNGFPIQLLIMSYPHLIDEVTLTKFENDFKEKCFHGFITC